MLEEIIKSESIMNFSPIRDRKTASMMSRIKLSLEFLSER